MMPNLGLIIWLLSSLLPYMPQSHIDLKFRDIRQKRNISEKNHVMNAEAYHYVTKYFAYQVQSS